MLTCAVLRDTCAFAQGGQGAVAASDGTNLAVAPSPGEASYRPDPLSGAPVVVVRGRQSRPNLPKAGACPFCPGGLEALEPYEVRWFKNRWPPLPDERCEVVLFSPEHSQSLGSLDDHQAELVIALWTERTEALGARPDVDYVLVFENRGSDVGATISHPHGQIYSFGYIPPVPLLELKTGTCAICDELSGRGQAGPSHARRVVASAEGWQAWSVWAPSYPFELLVAPTDHMGSLTDARLVRAGLVSVLKTALSGLDSLFGEPMPYMLWCHQRPTDGGDWPAAHLHFHIAPIWRDQGVPRYVASGEVGSGVMFNTVDPEDAAARLREFAK